MHAVELIAGPLDGLQIVLSSHVSTFTIRSELAPGTMLESWYRLRDLRPNPERLENGCVAMDFVASVSVERVT